MQTNDWLYRFGPLLSIHWRKPTLSESTTAEDISQCSSQMTGYHKCSICLLRHDKRFHFLLTAHVSHLSVSTFLDTRRAKRWDHTADYMHSTQEDRPQQQLRSEKMLRCCSRWWGPRSVTRWCNWTEAGSDLVHHSFCHSIFELLAFTSTETLHRIIVGHIKQLFWLFFMPRTLELTQIDHVSPFYCPRC